MTKIHLKTWGCSLNKADSEFMAGLLKEARFQIVDDPEEADVLILNSCTVKGPSESSLFKEIEKYKDSYKIIIITGCISQTDPEKLKGYALVGTKQIHKIVEVVEEALNENMICNLSQKENPTLELPKVRTNPVIEIIPICRGCLGNCSYCKTKAARGELISYPIKDIKMKVRRALKEGVKEIWLTAQDCGCYGFDIDTNLPNLLNELTRIEHDFKIRVGMMNPDHLLKIKDELIKAYQNEKVFKFLHLPVQSGNDNVLKTMNRKYQVEDFTQLVKEFKKYFLELTLATDIIVGFPGETDQQYWDTLNLVRQLSPEIVNISRFWARSKTPAKKMKKQIPGEEIKRRSRVLADIFKNIARLNNEKWLNQQMEIIINEKGQEKTNEVTGKIKHQWIGRNSSYKPVIVEGNYQLGEKLKVKITKISEWDLRGEVIHHSTIFPG